MRSYWNELTRWTSVEIHIPKDLEALWKSINLLRLNFQYSDANIGLFRSVNGFQTLIEALSIYFNIDGLKYEEELIAVAEEEELNLCADIANGFLGAQKENIRLDLSIYPACQALRTLVSRFYSNGDEYGDRYRALENVMKVLCRLCAKFGVDVVEWMSLEEVGMLGQVKLILEHALSDMEPGAATFNGRHLLLPFLSVNISFRAPQGTELSPKN